MTDAHVIPGQDSESEAIRLGFYLDVQANRWRHPEFGDYCASRARYALEDYTQLVKLNETLARINARRPYTKKRAA